MSDNNSEHGENEERQFIGVYEGTRNEEKKRHGKGKNTFSNGDVYEGEYVDGKRHGNGTYTWKAGHFYRGGFVSNVRHGEGYFVYPDGSKYNGNNN
jgi:radial spoke head protein 1